MRKKFIIIVFTMMMVLFCSCTGNNDSTYLYDDPIKSPSGKYLLEIMNGYNGVFHYKTFSISLTEDETNPKVIYTSNERYRIRDELYFTWDDSEDIVWVYSGDVGVFYWEYSDNGWEKHEKGERDYPESLKTNIKQNFKER